jgi:predicted transcriptional regulator
MKKSAHFGNLELRVLGLVQANSEINVTDLKILLGKNGKKLAYTTVMTICSRLHTKNILVRTKVGRSYIYSVNKTFQNSREKYLKDIQEILYPNEKLKSIVDFLKNDKKLNREELIELKNIINIKISNFD